MSFKTQHLQGKIALITGATSGIGLGIAKNLAEYGIHIVLNGFGDYRNAQQTIEEAGASHQIKTLYHPADLSKPGDIEDMVKTAIQSLGSIDILVNNAGIQHVAPIETFSTERWEAVLAVNLSSAFHTSRLVLPTMRSKGWGRIINIASTHGQVASANKSAYVAAKHGMLGLTKVVALETAQTNITCNAICPGWVLTPLVQAQIQKKAQEKNMSIQEAEHDLLSEKQPSLQFTTPKALGELVTFLCLPVANNVRGAAWNVDGGWTAQ